jgi:hypothetical protein
MSQPHAMGGFLLVWNPWGLFGLVPLIVCTAMGVFVFATRPGRKQNRRLAVFLVTDGIVTFAGPAGAAFAGSDATARIIFTVHLAGLFVVVPIMLRFLAIIDTPATSRLTRASAQFCRGSSPQRRWHFSSRDLSSSSKTFSNHGGVAGCSSKDRSRTAHTRFRALHRSTA